MSPVSSVALYAVFFFALSLCDLFGKADESELKRDPKIAGIGDTGRVWDEKGTFVDVNELDEVKTNQYGMEGDGM